MIVNYRICHSLVACSDGKFVNVAKEAEVGQAYHPPVHLKCEFESGDTHLECRCGPAVLSQLRSKDEHTEIRAYIIKQNTHMTMRNG